MANENPEYFLVMERRQLEAAASTVSPRSRQFEVLYAVVKPKNKLSNKTNVQTAEAATAEQYCVQDANEQLVKPKKLTKKGKTLRVDINDDHAFEILNFFERDASEVLAPQFVSHRKAGTGHFEALDASQDGVVEIEPDEGPSWCSRQDLVSAPVESVPYAMDDLRATSAPVYAVQNNPAASTVTTVTVLPEAQVATDVAMGEAAKEGIAALLPTLPSWLGIVGGTGLAMLGLGGGGGGGVTTPTVTDLVIQGRIMLGPVTSDNDLKVIAYNRDGTQIGTSNVRTQPIVGSPNQYIEYKITIPGGYNNYSGLVTLRLVSTASTADYVSEFSKKSTDLGSGNLYAVDIISKGTALKTINITQATDLAARQVLPSQKLSDTGPVIAADDNAVTAINVKTSQVLLNRNTSITTELPESTVTETGVVNNPKDAVYAQLLANLDEITQRFLGQGSSLDTIQKELSSKIIQDGLNTVTAPLFLTSLTTFKDGSVDDTTTIGIDESKVDDRTIAHVYTNKVNSVDGVFKVGAMSLLDKVTNPNPIRYSIVSGSDLDSSGKSYFIFDSGQTTDSLSGQLKWRGAPPATTPSAHPGYFEVVVEASQDTGKKDSSGNPIYSKVTQIVLVHVDTTGPNADLNSDISTPAAVNYSATVSSTLAASAGVAIAPNVEKPADADITKITIFMGGAGLDTGKDQIVLDVSQSLNANFSASGKTIGGVAVNYTYDAATKTLSLVKNTDANGGAATPFDPLEVIKAIAALKLQTSSTKQESRTFEVRYYDLSGNTGSAATSTLTLDNTAPNADLDDTPAGVNVTRTVNATQAGTGVAIAPNTQTPTDTDIAKVTLKLSGALDANNDQFLLGTTATLSNLDKDVLSTTATVGGVSVSYAYTASTKTLVITKTGGAVFTPKQVDDLVSAIQYKNTAPGTTTQGDRVFTVSYTDAVENTGSSATSTLKLDTLAPNADLDDNMASGAVSVTQTINASQAGAGLAIAPKTQTPTDTDIAKVTLVLSGAGLDLTNDQLVLDAVKSLDANFSGSNLTLGVGTTAVAGVDYSYDATSKTLVITKTGGTVFTPKQVDDLVSAIRYQNKAPATTTQRDRVLTVSYTDAVGNTGSPATSTLKVDTLGPNADLDPALPSGTSANVNITQTFNFSDASSGKSIAPSAPAPTESIATVTLVLGGVNDSTDKLDLGGTLLSLGAAASSAASIGGTSASYTYTPGTHTLVMTKPGGAFTPAEVQSLLGAIKLKNTDPLNALQTDRTVTVSYVDVAGNPGAPATATFQYRTQAPFADVNADSAQTDASLTVRGATLSAGTSIAADIQLPVGTPVSIIRIQAGGAGLDAVNDKLLLGTATLPNLGADVTGASTNFTITVGGVTSTNAYTYSYTASSKTLTIARGDGATFSNGEVQAVVKAIQLQTPNTNEGSRTFTVSFTDASGNTGNSAKSTITVDNTGPNADLNDDTTVGAINATQTVNASQAGAGVAIAPKTQTPTDIDIAKVTLKLTGALDTTNDQLVLDTVKSLNANFTGSNLTLGTGTTAVTGVDYSYDATANTLVITKTGGAVFTPKQVDDLVSAIRYQNKAPAATTQGDRVVTVTYTDAVGNTGSSATSRLKVDTLGPNADLYFDSAVTTQINVTQVFNQATANAGVSIAANPVDLTKADTPDSDITSISLKLSGTLDAAKDQLVLGTATLSNLGTDVTSTSTTLGGVSVSYTYTASSNTLVLTQTGGGVFTSKQVHDLVSAIRFKTSSTTEGDRVITVTYTDAVGNTGSSATSTLTLDNTAPKVNLGVSTVATDGSTSLDAKHSDKVLEPDETEIVLKVDSVDPNTGTALHQGDQVTLQVWDASIGTTGGWKNLSKVITNPDGTQTTTDYTQSVNFNDTTTGDGLGTAVYFKVDRNDLTPNFAENKLRVHVVDSAGNSAESGTEVVITLLGNVTLGSKVNAVTNLEVTSPIVITAAYGRPIAGGMAGKYIHIQNLDDGGSSTASDFTIEANNARYVQWSGDKIIITPPFDLDFGKHYQITIDDGAFKTQADTSKDIPSQFTQAVGNAADTTTGFLFNTVDISVSNTPGSAAQGSKMNTADGSVVNGKLWFSIDQPGTPSTVILDPNKDYAMVFQDKNPKGSNPNINDGAANTFDVTVTGFGTGDLIYGDDRNNTISQLNSETLTQIIDPQTTETLVHFDPSVLDINNPSGGTLRITNDGATPWTPTNLAKQIRISNANGVTPITAIDQVDSSGTVIAGSKIPSSVSDTNPLHIKITAAVRLGDVIALQYVAADGSAKNLLASTYTVTATDVTNGYVILDATRSQLNLLPQQDGFNKVFAQLTDGQTGAVSFSPLLGGDSGVRLDAFIPTPTLTVLAGQDDIITSDPADQVDLVIKAADLEFGETLNLYNSAKQLIASYVVDSSRFGHDLNLKTLVKSDLQVGDNVFTVEGTDASGNKASTSITIKVIEYVAYNGTVGLGPVLAGNDLQVTAYKADGSVMGTAKVNGDGTFFIDIDKSYAGAITLRVANKTTATATADYWDESTNAGKDMGTGSIAAVVWADGTSHTAHITALTDVVARTLVSADNKVAATKEQVNAYNLKLADLLGLSTTQDITNLLPTFVVKPDGTATLSVGGKYGQLLAQISDQQNFGGATLDATQSKLASGITWGWDATNKVATATVSGDMAKQVVLLAKVAQAAALSSGSSATPYLADTDLSAYGITGVSALSSARKADLLQRIVNSADDGSAYDTIAELQALANKVVALAKIQDYANSVITTAPTLTDYTAAGITKVTADNLATVNAQMADYSLVMNGKPSEDYKIQSAVDTWIGNALKVIVDYAVRGSEVPLPVPVPSAAQYAMVGIAGVTAANLAAVNTRVDADASLTGASDAAQVKSVVDAALASYNAAMGLVRAYISDAISNPKPDASTFAALGLKNIDTADEMDSANYYLSQVIAKPDAYVISDSDVLAKLKAQQTALILINLYAQDNTSLPGGGAPKLTDYLAAGVPADIATSANFSQLNATVDIQNSIPNAKILVDKLSAAVGQNAVPTLGSIVRAGTSVVDATYQNDAYLNANELGVGQTVKFTVSFDRAVKGLSAIHFGLSDSYGNALAGGAPQFDSVTSADGGKSWTVTVSGLTGLTSRSLRLNLVDNTGVLDAATGKLLSTSSFTGGESYTVDTANAPTLAAAFGQDLNLTSAETSVDLYVDPAQLTLGDTLKLSLGGNQIGSTVIVTATHLSAGVTFNVPKSSLPGASNLLTLTSTDVAGNIGTATATVNVGAYVQISGILGLPSQVLGSNDLKVTAYDASNNILGTGTVDAATNRYSLQLLKGADSYVRLQLSNGGAGLDYFDEATSATTDLGSKASTAISAVVFAGSADNSNVHLGLLTDVAARLIKNQSLTAAADIAKVNTAVATLLLGTASDITTVTPDFGIGSGGSYNPGATLYGQLLNQLSQQAASKGRALDVVLKDLAGDIAYDTTTGVATLNTPWAKEVFMLAKAQLATATGSLGTLTVQDLTDGGITGLSTLTAARQADLLQRIVNTSDDGNAVDTLAEVQALADQVLALGKIQDYASANTNAAPTLADYAAAGITGVNEDNLAAVNAKIDASDAAGTSSGTAIQALATQGASAHTAALAKIAAYANDSTQAAPTATDYAAAGVTGVTSASVVAVNAQIGGITAAKLPSISAIQSLADAGLVVQQDAVQVLKDYAHDHANTQPTLENYKLANLAAITTTDQVANANFLLGNLPQLQTWSEASLSGKLSAQVAAIQTISAYALSGAGAPDASTYQNAGMATVNAGNLADVNARMVSGTALSTTTQILHVLQAIDLDTTTPGLDTRSHYVADASTVVAAHQLFADIASAYADGIQTIQLAVSGADGANDQLLFAGVAKDINSASYTGTGLTLGGVTGVSWSYNSAHQFAFTKDDGSSFTASEAQSLEKALQFKSSLTAIQGARDFSLTHEYADGTSTAAVTAKVAVDTATHPHGGSFDAARQHITLDFGGVLSGTPQKGDFSNIHVGGASAVLNDVKTSGNALILALASSAFTDAVVTLDYTANAYTANRLISAGAGVELGDFSLVLDAAASNNAALVGIASKHNVIVGHGGQDTMTGGALADLFVFGAGTSGTSTITNFSFDQFDRIDLSGLIAGYTAGHDANYLKVSNTGASGADLQIQIDKDGAGNFTTGVDATLVLTGQGSTSSDLLTHLLKTNTLVL